MPADEIEQHVWNLLTRDFHWEIPADFGVRLHGGDDGPARLQIFEVAVAKIFSQLRPDYDWYVSPNSADGGLDFVGKQPFLNDDALGIAASVTVGGQCKKRTRVDSVVDAIAGSLTMMVTTIDPTFFIVAFSANISPERVTDARKRLEHTYRRNCHILDRRQIERLIDDYLADVETILREGLSDAEADEVISYFQARRTARPSIDADVTIPNRVLAGVPFSVTLRIPAFMGSASAARLWWRPHTDSDGNTDPIALVVPHGAGAPAGAELVPADGADDPVQTEHVVELITYAVGQVNLGELRIGTRGTTNADTGERIDLGSVQVVENMTPRFFEPPFRAGLVRLTQAYDRALARGVGSIGVVGAGGSGKSRVCEEFALTRRRLGASVISARQAKTLDDPHRVLADLFHGLVPSDGSLTDPVERVIRAIARYDADLAARAEPAIRAIFGVGVGSGSIADQSVLSSLLLLIVTQSRRVPLILHLQDLHWCTADVLLMLERLVWQLDQVASDPRQTDGVVRGVLIIFEGRIREKQETGQEGWVSEPFEAFLQKLDAPMVQCVPFTPDDGLEFVRRLFEDRYSSHRRVNEDLLDFQLELIEQVHQTAGGSPFHTLEQIQLLKERRVLGQNPDTGLLYLIQPAPLGSSLPDSVFGAIQLRWRYMRQRTPELALLVWGAALLEDRVPMPLFRRLWRGIAPDVSLSDVDATDMLWTGQSDAIEISFRHENYFRSIRKFEVAAEDRRRVVEIYSEWFDEAETRDPADQFRWARVLLELPSPDVERARALLDTALDDAEKNGDRRLARRISATRLNLVWDEDARSPIDPSGFLNRCDEDLLLIRDLLGSDRFQAEDRLDRLRARLGRRVGEERSSPLPVLIELHRRQLTAEILRSQILFNDRKPAMAAEVSARAVGGIHALRANDLADAAVWNDLEIEALHSEAVALALSGEIDEALERSNDAMTMARASRSSLSVRIISTHANILLAKDPAASEAMLRACLDGMGADGARPDARNGVEINLGMALVLRGYALGLSDPRASEMLTEARARLERVFTSSYQIGRYPNASAATLMLGIISALENDGDEVTWFAQAVAAASRGHKMETLWRAHVNLAIAMHRHEGRVTESVREHARSAIEILEQTLSSYAQPDRTARFDLIRVPMAQAVRLLILAGDETGPDVLIRYPGLRKSFHDPDRGSLRENRGAYRSHEWIRVGEDDYVIY